MTIIISQLIAVDLCILTRIKFATVMSIVMLIVIILVQQR